MKATGFTSPANREAIRQHIAQQVNAYLKKGGEIKTVEPQTKIISPIGQTWRHQSDSLGIEL